MFIVRVSNCDEVYTEDFVSKSDALEFIQKRLNNQDNFMLFQEIPLVFSVKESNVVPFPNNDEVA